MLLQPATIPVEIKRKDCKATRIDAKLCPLNPDLVAYVADKDLWVSHVPTGNDYRLTFVHDGKLQCIILIV